MLTVSKVTTYLLACSYLVRIANLFLSFFSTKIHTIFALILHASGGGSAAGAKQGNTAKQDNTKQSKANTMQNTANQSKANHDKGLS